MKALSSCSPFLCSPFLWLVRRRLSSEKPLLCDRHARSPHNCEKHGLASNNFDRRRLCLAPYDHHHRSLPQGLLMPVAELRPIFALRVAHADNSVGIAAVSITPAIFTRGTKRMAVATFVEHTAAGEEILFAS